MTASLDHDVVNLVTALDEAEMFVIMAARMHHSNQQRPPERRQCLCHLFHAGGMCGGQAAFVELLNVLCADADGGFQPGERGDPRVSHQEIVLLGALAHWQRHAGDFSDHALSSLVAPAASRIAAPLARAFAQELLGAGLILRTRLMEILLMPAPAADAGMSRCVH